MSMTEKLAYIKKLRHLTTEEIARHSGVPVGTLNKIFSGQTRHPAAEPMARLAQSPLRRDLGLGEDSVVLLFSTEGDTDPEHYRQVLRN